VQIVQLLQFNNGNRSSLSAECTYTSGIMSVKPIPTATQNANTIRRFMSVSSVPESSPGICL
jgi:hypothetical protein